jgi:O-antigen ligase
VKSIGVHIGYWIGALLFLGFGAVVVWYQQLYLFLVPPALVLFYLLLQKPHLFFYVLLISIPWSIEYHFSSSLGTDLPDEPLMVLNAIAVVIYLIYNRKTILQKGWFHPLIALLCAQFIWSFITVIWSTNILISVKYLLAKSWYLLAFAMAPIFFLNNRKRLTTAALLLAASMLLLVCVTMIRHYNRGFTFDTINESLTPFFRNHVNYSALLVCMVPLLIAGYAPIKNKAVKISVVLFFLLTLAALYVSYARGAWLALIVGLFVYWLLAKRLLVKAFFGFLIFCLASFFYLKHGDRYLQFAPQFKKTIFHTDFREHLIATYELKDVSTAERFYRWVAGINMVKDKPITGYGPGTFYQNYWGYTVPAFKTWVSNNEEHSTVHNYFLLLLIEQGAPGLLLFLFLVGYAFYRAQHIYATAQDVFWRRTAAAIAVLLAMICTVNFLSDLIETDKIGSVFYTCIGVLVMLDGKLILNKKASGSIEVQQG